MSFITLVLLAIGLCFDTFAVSISGGICMEQLPSWLKRLKIISFFGIFQAGFTFVGWLLGSSVMEYIESIDHWIAFGLLIIIGANMVRESLSADTDKPSGTDLLNTRKLALLSVATSIDALAVGISLSAVKLDILQMAEEAVIIYFVTALASLTGLLSGRLVGERAGKRSGIIGGVILILIGIKILSEHLLAL